jgi:hypothetical protein
LNISCQIAGIIRCAALTDDTNYDSLTTVQMIDVQSQAIFKAPQKASS